ncbi:isoprenyl transferase [Lactobacillus sp. S2-2]|uniref:isoprenyl transferase n=1 Tax=Lactobacillus sp. S2-2 TaxID=2692917 RepID=UPI001F0140C8|nr:isoprenyl transferase [Lactobacillus sp. S2-2]MCF6514943.1 isoprenyl transferase [Lactobacillus sp. S2-2]
MNKTQIDMNKIPNHVAIIMDGNGRWAKSKFMPRIAGHKQGMENVKNITEIASDLGVKILTLYAFSTENWKRPEKEVKYLMSLPTKFFNEFVPNLIKNNVKVQTIGDIASLPIKTKDAVNQAIEDTKECDGMVLNFALNYGSRSEIVKATKGIVQSISSGELESEDINEDTFSKYLTTSKFNDFADPDLLIRTSGEKRLSNFMLWQVAYSEFLFFDKMWPDVTKDDFKDMIITYQNRHRRFGGLNNK